MKIFFVQFFCLFLPPLLKVSSASVRCIPFLVWVAPLGHGEAAERSNPTSKEQWLCRCRRAERSYSMFKVRRGGFEEILLIQGKEQGLRFAGAAMKRYLVSRVRETQVRR